MAEDVGFYSSASIFPKVALCFSSLRDSLIGGMRCTGGGEPIVSRARDFTAFVALNFFFFLLGIFLPNSARRDGDDRLLRIHYCAGCGPCARCNSLSLCAIMQ